ncbi:hypothetical protein [Cerasicoccus fimbriatus]|uniref:hypothetical protein n=1 Tax=Cerasicoccus fimbriatus TaxID=3014554 RepID=UPI0022B43EBF|nr:hypothetical protein [Cerasicoccus sp. TK19100]
MNKSLLIITLLAGLLVNVGCESTDTADTTTTKPAEPMAESPAAAAQQMTASEKRVMQMQQLDRSYASGGMTPAEYSMRREQILEMY